MNPCRCGYIGITDKRCNKAPLCSQEYFKKISGPLLERIDMIVNIPYQNFELFREKDDTSEPSVQIRKRVIKARIRQENELKKLQLRFNSQITLKMFENDISIQTKAKNTLNQAKQKFNLSVRSSLKILRVAKTIADLDHSPEIKEAHLLGAITFKSKSI